MFKFTSFPGVLAAATIAAASPSPSAAVVDPANDFLATFAGAQNGDLDILSASVFYDGTSFRLSSTQNGAVGASAGSLFVWGINRGGGAARLSLGTPSVGASVLFDAVAVMFPDGLARAVTFPPAGPPSITPLTGIVDIDGDTITGLFPAALFPSNGFAPEDYTFTLWTRLRVNPAMDGTNAEIADFAPDAGGLRAAVPEPATWAMLILGFAGAGAILRRRRARPVPS